MPSSLTTVSAAPPHLFPKTVLEQYQSQLWNVPIEDFTKTFEVNSTAVFYTAVAFLGLLDAGNAKKNVEQKSQIIATTSIAAFNRKPLAAGFSYGLSKAATTHMMKQLATIFAPFHIRSNMIAPGLYESELTTKRFEGIENKEGSFPREEIPLTRGGTEEDMADCELYLCSRTGAYCNGSVSVTDGGRLSVFPSSF